MLRKGFLVPQPQRAVEFASVWYCTMRCILAFVTIGLIANEGVAGFADSIWTGTILVSYLFELFGKSNTKVGVITALQGAAQLVTAFPAGWAADRYSRSRIISLGGVGMLSSVGLMAYAVITCDHQNSEVTFYIHCASLAMFGFAGGIMNGPSQALLADSLPSGVR